jgi:hypothetical protein
MTSEYKLIIASVLYIIVMIYPLFTWSIPNSILAISFIFIGIVSAGYSSGLKRMRYSRISFEHTMFGMSATGLVFPAIAASFTIGNHLNLISESLDKPNHGAAFFISLGLMIGLFLWLSLLDFWSRLKSKARL